VAARSRGVELEAKLRHRQDPQPDRELHLFDTIYTRDPCCRVCAVGVPHNMRRCAYYSFAPDCSMDVLGAGVRYTGSTFNTLNTDQVPATRCGCHARRHLGKATAALKGTTFNINAKNLFDTTYVGAAIQRRPAATFGRTWRRACAIAGERGRGYSAGAAAGTPELSAPDCGVGGSPAPRAGTRSRIR